MKPTVTWTQAGVSCPSPATIGRQVDRFLRSKLGAGCSPKTLSTYKTLLGQFLKYIGEERRPGEITVAHISDFLFELRKRGLKPNSLRLSHCTLSSLYDFMVGEEVVALDIMNKIPKPKIPKRLPYYLNDEQVAALLDACDDNLPGRRDQAIIATFLGTGIRRGELIALNTDSLELSGTGGRLRVRGKGDKERTVIVSPRLAPVLSDWLDLRQGLLRGIGNERALFISPGRGRMTGASVGGRVRTLGKKAGIETVRVSPHTLRHTFATNFIAKGGDLYTLQRLLGHSNPQTTEVYVHISSRKLTEAFLAADPLEGWNYR